MAEESGESAVEKGSGSESEATTSNLTVALRIRPLKYEEYSRGDIRVAHMVEDKMVVLIDPQDDKYGSLRQKRPHERQYVFDVAFDGDSLQEVVYRRTTQPLVDMVMNGYNATVFAYGATGTGKTYTMVGTDREPGIMVRALNDLFRRVEETSDELDCTVTMTYLEIYNEMIRDLLNPSSGYLELREDAKKVQVTGITKVSTTSTSEVVKLLAKGNKARTIESTSANQTSSRSHALLEVNVRQNSRVSSSGGANREPIERDGKLYMIDLAGSERASNTQNRGKRLVEGAHINRSLLALGNCINALAERGSKYVNYRDSKLTRLLKDALSGNCRTVMIAHVSPSSSHFDETRNTLVYADRAKNIRNKIRRNAVDVTYHVAQYQTVIDELRQEINRLKTKINTSPEEIEAARQRGGNAQRRRKDSPEEMRKLKGDLMKIFSDQMESRRQLMNIDNHVLALSIEFEKQSMIVQEWESDKNRQNATRDNERLSKDAEDSDNEPEHVRKAWDDLVFIQDEQQRYWQVRQDVERQFTECRLRANKLEEDLPYRIGNEEHREVLSLLCKIHELEIEKMEMQAETLLKEHELRRKDMMLLRYDRQRNLCDQIINRQKAIINSLANGDADNDLVCPPELLDLYTQYAMEMDEMSQRIQTAKSRIASTKPMLLGTDRSILANGRIPRGSNKKLPRLKKEPSAMLLRASEDNNEVVLRSTPPSSLKDSNRMVFRRQETNGINSSINSPPSRGSDSSPTSTQRNSGGGGAPFTLPPIVTNQNGAGSSEPTTTNNVLEQRIKEGVRNINAVAARRRSIRTADKRNLETWYNNSKGHRGSSVGLSRAINGSALTTPVLHKKRLNLPLQSSLTNGTRPEFPPGDLSPVFSELGQSNPKRPNYYPPRKSASNLKIDRGDATDDSMDSLDNLDQLTISNSAPYRLSQVDQSTMVPSLDEESSPEHNDSAPTPSSSLLLLARNRQQHMLQTLAEATT